MHICEHTSVSVYRGRAYMCVPLRAQVSAKCKPCGLALTLSLFHTYRQTHNHMAHWHLPAISLFSGASVSHCKLV